MKEVYSFRTSDQNGVVTMWITFFSGDPALQRNVLRIIFFLIFKNKKQTNNNNKKKHKKKRKKKRERDIYI